MSEKGILELRERALQLFEQYEALLTDTQREIFSAYYRFDLSLSEIAEQHGISRAGVSDSLSKTVAKMEEFDSKLNLVEERRKLTSMFEEAEKIKNPEKKIKAYEAIGKAYRNGI